jgi:hypothetical protein
MPEPVRLDPECWTNVPAEMEVAVAGITDVKAVQWYGYTKGEPRSFYPVHYMFIIEGQGKLVARVLKNDGTEVRGYIEPLEPFEHVFVKGRGKFVAEPITDLQIYTWSKQVISGGLATPEQMRVKDGAVVGPKILQRA